MAPYQSFLIFWRKSGFHPQSKKPETGSGGLCGKRRFWLLMDRLIERSKDQQKDRTKIREITKTPIQNKVDLFLLIGDCTFQDEILTHANSKTQNLSFISSQKKSSWQSLAWSWIPVEHPWQPQTGFRFQTRRRRYRDDRAQDVPLWSRGTVINIVFQVLDD